VDEVVDIALADGAQVDLLINNAGVAYQGQFVDQDSEAISRQLQLDRTLSPLRVVVAAISCTTTS